LLIVCVQEEELYIDNDALEQLVDSATDELKLYDTFPEILPDSLQLENISDL